jgi:hypothetical protein
MAHDDPREGKMVASFADFLQLLTATRQRVLASGKPPTDIPDDLKAALLRLISE